MTELSSSKKLLRDMKVTAGCRFLASKRYEKKEKGSHAVVSLYSAVLICISMATFSLPLSSSLIRYFSFGGVAASILVLVMSMRNFAHQYGVIAEQLHRSALEVNEARRELFALSESKAEQSVQKFTERYNAILQKWSVNHDEEDFLKYKYKHKWEFDDIKDVADKDLPDKKFYEVYEATLGGVTIAILVGFAMLALAGYFIWSTISPTDDVTSSNLAASVAALDASSAASEAARAAADAESDAKVPKH